MLTKKTIFMSAQPDHPYFHWQVEVVIHNFMKSGINPNWIDILFAYDNEPSPEGRALASKYPMVRFFFYKKRITENYGYIPILRPDILEQHFRAHPELRGETVFYHDSDIIFRELPNFDALHGDLYWYVSDTISYIGAKYIKSKSEDIFTDLCSLSGIPPELVEANEAGSGGAQYLMKGVTADFWKEVAEDTLTIYKYMCDREHQDRANLSTEEAAQFNPIQKWCADMWSVLWGAWKMGAQTIVTPELDFSWGTSDIHAYNKCPIMHNAGVTNSTKDTLFYKADFQSSSPFDTDLSYVDPESASGKYVAAILYAKEKRK
jgi:hypothetical protein